MANQTFFVDIKLYNLAKAKGFLCSIDENLLNLPHLNEWHNNYVFSLMQWLKEKYGFLFIYSITQIKIISPNEKNKKVKLNENDTYYSGIIKAIKQSLI